MEELKEQIEKSKNALTYSIYDYSPLISDNDKLIIQNQIVMMETLLSITNDLSAVEKRYFTPPKK